jgi:hypothetical protein
MLYDNRMITIARTVVIGGKIYAYNEVGTLLFVLDEDEEMAGIFHG